MPNKSLVRRGCRDMAPLQDQTGGSSLELRKRAEQGEPAAQFQLGDLYVERYESAPNGGLESDYRAALHWYRKATAQGYDRDVMPCAEHSSASGPMSQVIYFCYFPHGPATNTWRSRAVDAEMAILGLSPPQDVAKAVAIWRKAAEEGDPNAQFSLGNFYSCGQGMPHDRNSEAVKWFRCAAELGHGRAQLALGAMLADAAFNRETESWRDPDAAQWLREAHEQGFGPVWMYSEFMDGPDEIAPQ